ncbi:hypothetical protein OAF34_06220 [Pirellulaceae bacterium]|jgi:hypothetical protein|nr:hypothetical protein [Pirellulaceae bacterium]
MVRIRSFLKNSLSYFFAFFAISGMLCSTASNTGLEERNLEVEDSEVEELISRRKESVRIRISSRLTNLHPGKSRPGCSLKSGCRLVSRDPCVGASERRMLNGLGTYLLI